MVRKVDETQDTYPFVCAIMMSEGVVTLAAVKMILCFAFLPHGIYPLFGAMEKKGLVALRLAHSKVVMNWTQKWDHFGVVIVIWGSAISFIYFGFYCDRQLRLHYS